MRRRRQLRDLRPIPLWRGGDIAEVCGNIGAQPDHLGPLLRQCLSQGWQMTGFVLKVHKLELCRHMCALDAHLASLRSAVLRPTGFKGTPPFTLMVPRWDLNTNVCNPYI